MNKQKSKSIPQQKLNREQQKTLLEMIDKYRAIRKEKITSEERFLKEHLMKHEIGSFLKPFGWHVSCGNGSILIHYALERNVRFFELAEEWFDQDLLNVERSKEGWKEFPRCVLISSNL